MAPSRRSIRTVNKAHEKAKSKEKITEEKNDFDDEQSTMSKDDLMKFLDLRNLPTDTILRNTESDEHSEDLPDD